MEDAFVPLSILTYVLICFIVASTAENRGHKLSSVFFVSLLVSPLIGAILFSSNRRFENDLLNAIRELKESQDRISDAESTKTE